MLGDVNSALSALHGFDPELCARYQDLRRMDDVQLQALDLQTDAYDPALVRVCVVIVAAPSDNNYLLLASHQLTPAQCGLTLRLHL